MWYVIIKYSWCLTSIIAPYFWKERSHLRWLEHLLCYLDASLGRCFEYVRLGGDPREDPRVGLCLSVAWKGLGVPPNKMEEACMKREVWVFLLKLLPSRQSGTKIVVYKCMCQFLYHRLVNRGVIHTPIVYVSSYKMWLWHKINVNYLIEG